MLPVKTLLYLIVIHYAGTAIALIIQILLELRNKEGMSKDRFGEIIRASDIWEVFLLSTIYSAFLKLVSRF